jgi:micrococcal nuclease
MKNFAMKILVILCCFFLSVLLTPVSSIAEVIHGKVVRVADGDTITVLTQERQEIKIRLAGIDTPEKRQAFGQKAKQFTSSIVAGKNVTVDGKTTDRYGRTVGMVFVNGGKISVNEQIVAEGYGWVYRQYCKYDFCYDWLKLEEKARKARMGLWADPNPTPPWEWRRQQ